MPPSAASTPAAANPLVIRFGAVGDMIMTTPLLRALAERHGRPCDVIGRGRWLPLLLRHLPFVGTVHCVDSLRLPHWLEPSKQAITRWLRQRADGPVYLLQGDPLTQAMARRGGLTVTADNDALPRRALEHTCDRHRRLAGFPAATYRLEAELAVSAGELAECQRWLAGLGMVGVPLVLIQAGNRKTRSWRMSATERKHWPVASWAGVARGVLAAMPDARVLLIGAPKEQPLARAIAHQVGSARVLALADQLPLRRLFALQRLAHSLISVDTGPAHAAAALGCPAVVLFGHTDPRITGPRAGTGPVRTVHPPGAPALDADAPWPRDGSLAGITPQQVVACWEEVASAMPAFHTG